ncbi:ABC transporter permease [Natrinema halophilum]|uniref:ABC transporter permease n=1 Tax=Natrinema halophilum TaxID=1699371 RepID=A0A7D5H8P8_9EURY|nr:ABC transporter permease [Natrinema halophilum]QLG49755.1 ABC transporter permease [Natrinema halophilum]
MSSIIVAKKDFQDAVRSRALIGLTLLFALFTVGGSYLASEASSIFGSGGGSSTLDLLIALQTPASYLVPIIALFVGYGAIAGERESGSLKFLLGLPHRRRDVVLGKILGRTGVVVVSILVGFAVGLVALFAFVGSVSLRYYVLFTLMTVLFAFVYVCIGVGLSSMTRSTTRAAAGAFGFIVLFKLLWGTIGLVLMHFIEGEMLAQPMPDWYLVFVSVPPDSAFNSATSALLNATEFANTNGFSPENLPLIAEPWFGFVLLAAWALVPLGLGIWRFDSVDL